MVQLPYCLFASYLNMTVAQKTQCGMIGWLAKDVYKWRGKILSWPNMKQFRCVYLDSRKQRRSQLGVPTCSSPENRTETLSNEPRCSNLFISRKQDRNIAEWANLQLPGTQNIRVTGVSIWTCHVLYAAAKFLFPLCIHLLLPWDRVRSRQSVT
jgi:hypothetical protein